MRTVDWRWASIYAETSLVGKEIEATTVSQLSGLWILGRLRIEEKEYIILGQALSGTGDGDEAREFNAEGLVGIGGQKLLGELLVTWWSISVEETAGRILGLVLREQRADRSEKLRLGFCVNVMGKLGDESHSAG